MTFILAADIGRQTRLRLVQIPNEPVTVHTNLETSYENRYRTDDYKGKTGFETMVRKFLNEDAPSVDDQHPSPTKACIAVPCFVQNNAARLNVTRNNPWSIDGNSLQQVVPNIQIRLINDFEAVGYGVTKLLASGSNDFYELQKGDTTDVDRELINRIAVIGAGSGLGEAFVIMKGENPPEVYPSEGGHVNFGPNSQDELDLWKFLHDLDRLHIDVEQVVSGAGIVDMYRFWRDRDSAKEDPAIREIVDTWKNAEEQFRQSILNPAAEIAKYALFERDSLCQKAMRMFTKCYGSEAGNVALKHLSYGGVFVAGSIAPRILPLFDDGGFMEAFKTKSKVGKNILPKIPVSVVLNPLVGLIGATDYAARKMN